MSLKSSAGFLAVLRFLLVLLLTGIWIGIEFFLYDRFFFIQFSASDLDVPSVFLNALQFLPKFGDFLGFLTASFGIDVTIPDMYHAGLLFEVVYTLSLAFFFSFAGSTTDWLLKKLNIQYDTASFVDKIVHVLNTLIVVIFSILSTNLLCTVLRQYLHSRQYLLVASIIILGLLSFTLFYAKKKKPLDAIGNLLISLLSVALIYLMVMSGYCLSNSKYLITSELLASIICFVSSLLVVTFLGAKFFSEGFTP